MRVLSCELHPDNGTLFSIDCLVIENEVANSMYQRSQLDWLLYNDPLMKPPFKINFQKS